MKKLLRLLFVPVLAVVFFVCHEVFEYFRYHAPLKMGKPK